MIVKNSIYLGNIYKSKDGYAGAVFAINAPCPTIKANSGGNSQPMIITRRRKNEYHWETNMLYNTN